MGSGFGIAAIVVFCLSLGVPVIGNFITLLALVLVVFSALGGNKIWPIAISAASGVKLFFLSPTWMAAIYQDLTWMLVTLAFVAAPIIAMLFRGGKATAIAQRSRVYGFVGGECARSAMMRNGGHAIMVPGLEARLHSVPLMKAFSLD